MSFTLLRVSVFALALFAIPGLSLATSCIQGSCHASVLKFKYLHGPVAAEQSGAGLGCSSCHKSTGKPCTATAKGSFTFAEQKDKLCTICHEKSESPDHVARVSNCLKCHLPHGSDKSKAHTRF